MQLLKEVLLHAIESVQKLSEGIRVGKSKRVCRPEKRHGLGVNLAAATKNSGLHNVLPGTC